MIIDSILNIIFPNKCMFCGEILEFNQGVVCNSCKTMLDSLPITSYRTEYVDKTIHVYPYTGNIRNAILRYKFKHKKGYSKYFAKCMVEVLKNKFTWEIDAIAYVPLGRRRWFFRGYNQSYLLAKHISDELNIPIEKCLIKKPFVKRQSNLTYSSRKSNIENKFYLSKDIQYKKILLVDDIFTTGSTVNECARVLKYAGVTRVYCITLAKSIKYIKNH